MRKKVFAGYIFLAISLTNCKKDKETAIEPTNESKITLVNTPSLTRDQLTLDSIFLYAKETYLWNEALPSYEDFKPQSYAAPGNSLNIFEQELFAVTRYKINSITGKPYEYSSSDPDYPKYSYIDDNKSTGATALSPLTKSSVSLEGIGYDFGIGLSAVTASDIRIRYVNPGSPAALNGLSRGNRIVAINGRTSVATTQTEVNYINDAFESASISLKIEKTDGSLATVTLNKTTYNSNPIYKTTIIESGGKKIGYLAFARFSNSKNSETVLTNAFKEFSTAGITDLVIDLRYNGGGYVSTAQHLANLIAPAKLTGKVMYTEYFNNTMQQGKATILKYQPLLDNNDQPIPLTTGINGKYATYADVDYSIAGNTYKFSKKGSLEGINTVCFIVSGNTASASELTLNALKPYMKVKLVGSTTYGKPVGFFGIDIDKYTVYMSNFQSKNANGEGDYFNGLSVDIPATDDPTRDFGDPNEVCLSKAISYITSGTTLTANVTMTLKGGAVVSSSQIKPKVISTDNEFKGMIETRYKLK